MSQSGKAKKERSRERQRARVRIRRLRNGLIALAILGAIGAVIALGVVAGSGDGGGSGGSSRSDGSSSVGGLAPDFRVRTTSWSGGEEFVLSQQRGKPVVLYAVASWCFTCIPEAQALGKIYREVGDKVTILIISVDPNDSEDSLLKFKEISKGGDHLWALDKDGEFVRAFDVRTLDTTVIIDPEGRQVYRDGVPTSEGKLRDELAKLLDVQAGAPAQRLPGKFYPNQGQEHLQPGQTYDSYNSNPPTSGPHDPKPVAWGVYDTPVPKEKLVHNLEHGGVLILYNCPDGCPDLVNQLKQFGDRYVAGGQKVVVAPYPGMGSRLALVAWTYLDMFDELDPARVAQFIEADLGSRAPEANIP